MMHAVENIVLATYFNALAHTCYQPEKPQMPVEMLLIVAQEKKPQKRTLYFSLNFPHNNLHLVILD